MPQQTKQIRFGLTAIKGMGEDTVEMIIRERNNNGSFTSLQDFAKRVPAKLMNKKTLEALAFSGAFDEFGDRKAIVDSLEELAKFAKEHQEKSEAGQIGLFGGVDEAAIDFTLKDTKATKEDILAWERESLGLFVSDHPLKGLGEYFKKYGHLIGKLTEDDDGGQKRTLHGLVTQSRKIITKKGKNMAVFTLEDTSGKMECAVFPMIYEKINPKAIEVDQFIRAKVKVEERDGMLNGIVDEVKIGNLQHAQEASAQIFTPTKETTSQNKTESSTQLKITIPDSTTKDQVTELKKWLSARRSNDPEAQEIAIHIQGKTISIPFRVAMGTTGEHEIANILK